MKKVLVLWADSKSANFGVRVLADGMAALAREAWGEDIQVDFQDYGRGDSEVSFGARSIARDVRTRNGPIRNKLKQYDLVLDSGAGDSFTDAYGLKRLTTMLYAQRVAFHEKIPVVMGPQTVGPFTRRLPRFAAARSLRRINALLTRDSASADYAEELGRREQSLTTDVVFALPRETVPTERDVVLNVSGLLWFSDAHLPSEKYRSLVKDLVERLIAAGRSVTLLAHVVNEVSVVDDRAAISSLRESISGELEVVIPGSLAEIRRVVGGANVVIGSRMHACLNGLSMGTPAIPWAYSRKFAPLMEDIGWVYGYDLRTDRDIVERTMADLEVVRANEMRAEVQSVLRLAETRLDVAVQELRRFRNAL